MYASVDQLFFIILEVISDFLPVKSVGSSLFCLIKAERYITQIIILVLCCVNPTIDCRSEASYHISVVSTRIIVLKSGRDSIIKSRIRQITSSPSSPILRTTLAIAI